MKVTLIHGKYFNSWEALGLGYIGSYLKRHVDGIEINYFQGCFDSDDAMVEGARDSDVACFSCTTPTFPHAVKIARRLKAANPEIRTVVGGYHPSAAPQQCLVEGIDQVVVGEGEAAALGIVRGDRSRIVTGRPMDFAELPWPDRVLIRNERNIQVAFRDNAKRITSVQSHRACPFRCKYCLDGFYKVLYGDPGNVSVRYRPVTDLLDEMDHITRVFGLDLIKFSDPTWNTDIEWVKDFCRTKIERGPGVPFYPNIHATLCSEEMIRLMGEAECHEIAIGIESGSPKILKQIGKGTTVETIRRSVEWAKKYGLLVRGYFILGMPEETEEDLRQTERLADDLDLDEYGFSLLCPYPGTQMYDEKKYRAVDWEKADEYSNDFWRGRHLSNERLKQWQRHLAEKFSRRLTWHNQMQGGAPDVGAKRP